MTQPLRIIGVSRDIESPGEKSALVAFNRRPTDDELRSFHDCQGLPMRDAYEVASEAEVERLKAALNERDLFINPHLMEQAADEIDCGGFCENIWWESDTNASGCRKSEKGEYCPNDVAETLRAVAKVARAALTGEKP